MRGRDAVLRLPTMAALATMFFALLATNCGGSHPSQTGAGVGGAGGSPVTGTSVAGSAVSAGGQFAIAGAAGIAGNAPTPLPHADEVFSEKYVLEYHLTISEADLTSLEEHGDEERYVPATLTVRGGPDGSVDLGKVGVRHKGDTTLQPCWRNGVRSYANECARLSYKLSFDEYATETRLFGLKRLHLNVSYGDPTRLRELLAHDLFAAFGVITPRAAPTAVYINGSFTGLFIAVEDVDGRFTQMHFPNGGNGNLYKEAWPRTGQPDSYFLEALRTNEGATANVTDMQQFATAVASLNATNFSEVMSRWIDVENLLRYLAVDRAIKNWDGITAIYNPEGPHNFYFYHDDGSENRFHLVPWDFNGAGLNAGVFVNSDPYMDEHPGQNRIPNVNVAPGSCSPISIWNISGDPGMTAPGCDPLLRFLVQTQWTRWVSLGQQLLAGPMSAARIQARIDAYASLMDPLIELDPLMQKGAWSGAVQALPSTIASNRAAFEALLAEGYRAAP